MADKRVIEQTASTEIYSDDWFLKDSVLEGTSKISGVNLKELLGADGTLALEEIANAIAEEYDSTHTYSLNSWVFHEGVLYRCISQSTTGTWDATKWQAKTIKEFIDTAKNSVLSTIEQMLGEYLPISTLDPPSIEAISKGDIFIYQRTNRYKFYRAKADHPQGVTEFDIDDWDEFDTVADLIEDVTENAGKVADVQVKTTDDYETTVNPTDKISRIDLSSVTAYGEVPNLPQAIASFSDGADAPMKSLKVAIEPQQDLHGYDHPWAGGAGKNKLQVTGTSQTVNGVTFTVNDDGSIIVNGTATADARFAIGEYILKAGSSVRLNGSPVDGSTSTIALGYQGYGIVSTANSDRVCDRTSQSTDWDNDVYIGVASGYTANNLTFKPMIRLASVTDATFAPYSNICPISGWDEANVSVSGKNLFNPSSLTEGKTINSDGSIDNQANRSATVEGIPIQPNSRYTISYVESIRQGVFYYDKDDNFISFLAWGNNPRAFLTPSNAYYVRFSFEDGTAPTNVMLNIGETAQTYTAYNGTTYTIDLDGTRYGGELDVVSGVLTLTHKIIDLGTQSWGKTSLEATIIYISIQDKKSGVSPILCSSYKYESDKGFGLNFGAISDSSNQTYINYVFVRNQDFSGKTDLECKTAMNGVQLVYELATPLTIQLTPTQVKSLLGSNNVWADTGDINECVYRRDMSSTIDDILARIEALEG